MGWDFTGPPRTEDISQCLKTFLVVTTGGEWGGFCWYWVGGARDVGKHPRMHRPSPPTTRTYLVPNVNCAKVEKPQLRGIFREIGKLFGRCMYKLTNSFEFIMKITNILKQ